MAKKQQMRKCGSLAIEWLKIRRRRTVRGNRNHHNPNPPNDADPAIDEVSTNPNTHPADDLIELSTNPNNNPSPTNDLNEVYRAVIEPSIDLTERRMESSLKSCSAISNNKKDIAFNQTENTSNDKLNPTPVSAARHMESSLKRCSALSNDKDTAFNQTENTSNDKLNPTPVSAVISTGKWAATRILGSANSRRQCVPNRLLAFLVLMYLGVLLLTQELLLVVWARVSCDSPYLRKLRTW